LGPKQDPSSSTVPPRKVRPRGNAAPAAASGDLYSFAALAMLPDPGAQATSESATAPMSTARAAIAAAKASSRRNSLQSMQAAAEKNNPYAALASSLGGMQAAAPNGIANSFASADARAGGKPIPSVRPAARAAVSFDSFAMADARVGGVAMPSRLAKFAAQQGPGAASPEREAQQETTAVTSPEQPAAAAPEAASPNAVILCTAVRPAELPPTPFAATETEDTAQPHSGFSALSAPLPVATDHKDSDDDQTPPNPFASSSKRSVPQLEGWRKTGS
jgi:hypothetical protein